MMTLLVQSTPLLHVNGPEFPEAIAKMKGNTIKGDVDMMNNRVSGVFSEIENIVALPIGLFYGLPSYGKHMSLSAEEYASLILHEVGHVFTTYELAARTCSTNQILDSISCKAVGNDPRNREIVVAKAADILELSKEEQNALRNAKDKKEMAVLLMYATIEESRSQLGVSIYDSTSCEQLADQYSARCGAGRHLVIALDKIYDSDKKRNSVTLNFITLMLYPIITFGFGFITYITMAMLSGREDAEYDTFHARVQAQVQHTLAEHPAS